MEVINIKKLIYKKRVLTAAFALGLSLAIIIGLIRTEPNAQTFNKSEQGIPVPIVMYHSIQKDKSRAGDYIVSPEIIESDFKYLADRGYQSVVMADLIAYVTEGTPLPPKPVVITFDDGYLNNLSYLPDILDKYQYRAVISVVGEYTDIFQKQSDRNLAYAHMNWEDIAQMAQDSRFEVQNHSYYMHHQTPRKGSMRKKGESKEEYKAILSNDIVALNTALAENCGITPSTFTYPYGQISSGAEEIIRELGFSATLSCFELVSKVAYGEPDTLYSLGRFNRAASYTTEAFMERMGIK